MLPLNKASLDGWQSSSFLASALISWSNLSQAAARDSELRIFVEATLTSVLVVLLHGLVDDALYSNAGSPVLFLLPGMAIGS